MDENPFSILKSNSDILFVYDYTDPVFSEFDFSTYENISLLAFSYGVYASSIAKLPANLKIQKKVAINGTLIPVDDKFGVPQRQFELTEKMDSQTVIKFRERLFGGKNAQEHFRIFEENLTQRSAKSCTDELVGMKTYVPRLSALDKDFDKIYIAKFDRCVPTRNQINFWQNLKKKDKIELDCGHFPFYNYEYIEEFL